MSEPSTRWELIYWPGIEGRAQVIRFVLEAAGVEYRDYGLEGRPGAGVVVKHTAPDFIDGDNIPSFACPIIRHGDFQIAQSVAILQYLGHQLDLCPKDIKSTTQAHQIVLTINDFQQEYTQSHHPFGEGHSQNQMIIQKAESFRTKRIPKFLGYFNRTIAASPGPYLLPGGSFSYADIALFALIDGLKYSFPNIMAHELAKAEYEKVETLWKEVRSMKKIKAFLESERCIPYADGLFMRTEGTDVVTSEAPK